MSKLNNWFIEFDNKNTIIRLVSNENGVGNNSYSDGNGIGHGRGDTCGDDNGLGYGLGYGNGDGDDDGYGYSDIFGVNNDYEM